MDEKLMNNIKSESRWLRLVFMVLFAAIGYLAAMIVVLLALVQAVFGFIRGESLGRLLTFSASLNQFIYQIMQFLTYNSEIKPYPFSDWPGQPPYNEQEDPYLHMDAADIPERDKPESQQ